MHLRILMHLVRMRGNNQQNKITKNKKVKVQKLKKIDFVKKEKEMVRLFGEIHPNSKLAWNKWAKEFNERLPDDAGPNSSLASLTRK